MKIQPNSLKDFITRHPSVHVFRMLVFTNSGRTRFIQASDTELSDDSGNIETNLCSSLNHSYDWT